MLFSHFCFGCQDCMFCFSQSGARTSIGNNALPKERYAALKRALVSQMADMIRAKKPPTLARIFG
jgi:hypothetical protein